MTIKFPAIVTTLNTPADKPISVACNGVYPVTTTVEFADIASSEQLCSLEHSDDNDDIDGVGRVDVISGIDDERTRRLCF